MPALSEGRLVSAKYLPLVIELPDKDTGEVRRVELSYSTVSMDKAFLWERQLRYIQSAIRQWLELLDQLVERDAERSANSIRQEERVKGALE